MVTEQDARRQIRDLLLAMAPYDVERPSAESLLVDQLGYNSLVLMELVFAVEEEFGVQLLDDEDAVFGIKTLGQAEDHIYARMAEDAHSAAN